MTQATRPASETIVVLDLSVLRLCRNRTAKTLTVRIPGGEQLSPASDVGDLEDRPAAAAAFDHALVDGRCAREGGLRRIGLYNPWTAEVAVAGPDGPRTYRSEVPVPLEAGGSLARVDDDVLTIADHELRRVRDPQDAMVEALTAHRAPW